MPADSPALMPLQTSIFYGPMASRRFGISLGVNLLPPSSKVCTYDCGYCQYEGFHSLAGIPRAKFPTPEEVGEAAEERLASVRLSGEAIDWIMIAGNGEPTLHPHFTAAVRALVEARDRFLPGTRIGILSNSRDCHRFDVRAALRLVDGRFMKLDAGSSEMIEKVNRPRGLVDLERMLEGLKHLALDPDGIVIQAMFVQGSADNTDRRAVNEWIEAVRYVGPVSVQLYTVDRRPQDGCVTPAPRAVMEAIAHQLLARTRIEAEVF